MRRPLRAAILAAGLLAAGCSSSPTGGDDDGPTLGAASVQRDVTYCVADGVELKLDLYHPAGSGSAPRPLAIHIHGGGWQRGDKATGPWFLRVGEALISRGFVVASVNHRLAPEHRWPAQIHDVKCAVRHLRANAGAYRVDPARIGVWGNSSGGHLAALLGVTDPGAGLEGTGGFAGVSSRVQAVVSLYGASDLTAPDWPIILRAAIQTTFGSPPDPASPVLVAASPRTHVSADDPPFLLIHGAEDHVILPNQSEWLAEDLQAAGVPASLVLVANGEHELVASGGPLDPSEAEITAAITAFFLARL
ncbi:MAG: alpha/beta hydrolase fold domain-containing protein [Gemmatimonadota bacterium]